MTLRSTYTKKRDVGGFDLASIQWVGGNGYIIEVYLQAILPPGGQKEARQLTSVTSITFLNPYDCLRRPSLFNTFSVSEEDVHQCTSIAGQVYTEEIYGMK